MSADERDVLDVLVVDDDPAIRGTVERALQKDGHRVRQAADAAAALQAIEAAPPDVVVLDINMPGRSGLDALPSIREASPGSNVVVLTGEATIQNARVAVQRGAHTFLTKPPHLEYVREVVAEAGRVARLRAREGRSGTRSAEAAPVVELGMVGRSPALQAMLEQVRLVAPAQGRVLVTGENGSGKELVALAVHALSKRASGPFVKLNCAAIPKDLVESELFGYERGAFTGAVQAKKGRLELADQGTLFLDEVGDLSLEAQAKLLRAIETGEVEPLGSTRTARVDVRILSATNKDLAAALENGEFRQDLYYRLNVLPLHVPALRERRGDIPLLAAHFLAQLCAAEGVPTKRLGDEARQVLEEYPWPGNVRELRNLMERAAVLVPGEEIRAEDLTPWLESAPGREEGAGLRGEIERREEEAIRKALETAGWNVTQAAAGLGIDRTNLHRKMRKYGIARRP
jgi:two-component system, NtrC family, nitrogen regulation response regulator NtrX